MKSRWGVVQINTTLLLQLKHKISFAATLIILGIIFSTTSFGQTACNAGTSVNLVSGSPILYSRYDDGTTITNTVPLIANASSYARSGNNIVVQTSWRWGNGGPPASSTQSTQTLRINGTAYATLTTTTGASTTGTFQLFAGATGSTANITGDTGTFDVRNITLPSSVTSITSIDFVFSGGIGAGDDILVNITNASACSSALSVTKSSNASSWTVGQPGATYTLNVTNTGAAATAGTTTILDQLPAGIGVRPATGFTAATGWTCSYQDEFAMGAAYYNPRVGQLVTCTSTTPIAVGSSVSLTIPVNVTSLAAASVTNYASIGGGIDPHNSWIAPTPGATCSNAAHCASATTGVTALTPPPASCAAGTPVNLLTTLLDSYYNDNGVTRTGSASLISGANNYTVGTGSGGRFVADMTWFWNNGYVNSGGVVSTSSTYEVKVNNITYALLTTYLGYEGYATITPQNGATLMNGATSTFEINRLINENVWLTLPSSVTSISNVDVRFVGGASSGDDVTHKINAIYACSPTVGITKTSNSPSWLTGQSGAIYTLNVTNSGAMNTFGTINVLDTLPTGIIPNWTGTNTVTSNGITWACTFSGQNVTCVTTNNLPNVGTNTTQIAMPVSVTYSTTSGPNTNFASVGGGGDPNNSGNPPTPGVTCSDTTHCASTQTTVSASSPNISLLKSCPTPTNCTTTSQLPGTDLTYKIAFTNTGGQSAANMAIVDGIPTNTDYKLGSAAANVGTTGLTIVIEYSSDYNPLNPTAATWGYTPVSGGGGASVGYDRLVKAVRWRVTAGTLSNVSPNNTGDVSFITKIK